jgi:hypothetical protein
VSYRSIALAVLYGALATFSKEQGVSLCLSVIHVVGVTVFALLGVYDFCYVCEWNFHSFLAALRGSSKANQVKNAKKLKSEV